MWSVPDQQCRQAIVNVGFRAVGSNSWNSALSSKAASDRLQLNVGSQSTQVIGRWYPWLSGPHQRQTIPVRGVAGRAPLLFHAPLPLLARQSGTCQSNRAASEPLVHCI